MPANQIVFTGVPAFVSTVTGPTTVQFFIDENDFDPAQLLEVDLAQNPSAIQEQAWATSVQCDSQITGGMTTIGPRFHGGNHVGGVYLAERVIAKYTKQLSSWPPAPDDLYQYQLVMRASNGNVTRFHGFKVRVLSPAKGTLVHVAFIRVGASAPAQPVPLGWWIDLADAAVCDPQGNGFTTIVPSSPVGTVGAAFLSSEVVALDGPSYPKWPRYLGW